jgi:hypothetical protein
MGIILRTQKMAAGHAAAAFHKHCIKLHYGWLERRLSPSSFSLKRRGRSQRIGLDPGIHVQQAPLHNPAQITLCQSCWQCENHPVRVLSHIVRAHGATRERIVLSKKHGG